MKTLRDLLLSAALLLGLALLMAGGLALSGCPVDLPDAPAPNVHVVNSAWEVVRSDVLTRAREITSTDGLEAEVADYNATHTDDQWTILYGEVPPIELAPTVDAYIVTSDTHDLKAEYHDVPRADLVERRDAWRLEAELAGIGGSPCVLYVDNVPPAPEPPAVVDPWVLYAIYVIDALGGVVYEEHPSEAEYPARLRAWGLEVEMHNALYPAAPWSLVTGRVWP